MDLRRVSLLFFTFFSSKDTASLDVFPLPRPIRRTDLSLPGAHADLCCKFFTWHTFVFRYLPTCQMGQCGDIVMIVRALIEPQLTGIRTPASSLSESSIHPLLLVLEQLPMDSNRFNAMQKQWRCTTRNAHVTGWRDRALSRTRVVSYLKKEVVQR